MTKSWPDHQSPASSSGTLPPAFPEPRDQLHALTSLVLEVSSQRGVGDVLDVALRQCLSLTGSEFGFVGLIRAPDNDIAAGELEIVAIHGFHPAPSFYFDHRVIPLRPNIFNRVILEDRPVRTPDAAGDPLRVGQPQGHPAVRAFLGVPLRLDNLAIGMIGLANRAAPYEDERERLALTYASLIAVLVTAIQSVAAGERALGPRVTSPLVQQLMGEAQGPDPRHHGQASASGDVHQARGQPAGRGGRRRRPARPALTRLGRPRSCLAACRPRGTSRFGWCRRMHDPIGS